MRFVSLLLYGALLCGGPAAGQGEYPPGTFELTPETDLGLVPVPVEVPEAFKDLVPEGKTLNLPPGFSVKVFAAEGLQGPRFMAFSPEGVLHAANMRVRGRDNAQIVALPDRDNDGVADEAVVVAEGFAAVHSLAFYGDALYAADPDELVILRDPDGDGIYQERKVLMQLPKGGLHFTRTVVFDQENGKGYVSIGSTCDICREDDPEYAAVVQFNPDGSGRRIFATGMRNSVGLDFHPLSNQLWATNNGHGKQGRSLPPEWINIIEDGGFYGWPFAYGFRVWVDFDVKVFRDDLFPLTQEDSLLVETMPRPTALLPAHMAPMAIHFYDKGSFPSRFRNNAFVALRSGMYGEVPGYKVISLFSEADGSNAQVAEFMTGFQPIVASAEGVWGQPVGLATDQAGHLYVSSDWVTFAIFRIEYDNPTAVQEEAAPQTFSLAQNYPNPFNSGTTIPFALEKAGAVEIAIYDLQGQRVATLERGARSAGRYAAAWDGLDASGKEAASGVYFYRLEAEGRQETRKLLLLR